jgi:arylsulfatase A-like enzyme
MHSGTLFARPRLRRFAWTGLLLLAACRPAPPPPRHLVLVVFDTLRADRMSIYGYPRPTTPFLDGVADELVRFAQVKAPASWTLPAHASLFTARWPVEHGASWGNKWLDGRFDTLAEALQTAGFCTFGLAANPILSKGTGLTQGFEHFYRVPPPEETRTDRLLKRVPKLLDEAATSGCRLFLFINLMDTHTPFSSEAFADEFGVDAPDPIPGPGVKWAIAAGQREFSPADRRLHEAAYDAAVRTVDETSERLMTLLRDRSLLDDTLLILTSDHGEGLGTHAELGHVISIWEEQLAVPLLVRFPHGRRGGTVIERTTSSTFLAPSALDWLQVARPAGMAGSPGLEDDVTATADYRSYFDPAFTDNQRMAKRYPELVGRVQHEHATYCPPYKLLVRADESVALYDITRDPGEQTDLSTAEPRALRSCMAAYRTALAAGRFMPFELELSADGVDHVDTETLRSLGYIQ